VDYINFLESKKTEKINSINDMVDQRKKDREEYILKQKDKEKENDSKIKGKFNYSCFRKLLT
jgi:hypothetical protein